MAEGEENSISFLFNNNAKKPSPFGERILSQDEGTSFLSSFFVELVSQLKKTLVSIKSYNELSRGRFKDERFGEYFNKKMSEDIEKINTVLAGFFDYMKVNMPIRKANTIHHVIGEVLNSNKQKLEEKKIKIFKKFEENLPETTLHDEQLKYAFHSIVQFALPLIPNAGSLGFLTRLIGAQKEKAAEEALPPETQKSIEVLILFSGFRKPGEPVEVALGIPGIPKDDVGDLILRLVKEIVQKNCGEMKLESHEKEARTLVTLILPIERRKVFFYQPARA